MTGIRFVTDSEGQKVAVQIDLKKLRYIWEDFYDNLIAKSRDDEPRESFASVKELLKKKGKLNE